MTRRVPSNGRKTPLHEGRFRLPIRLALVGERLTSQILGREYRDTLNYKPSQRFRGLNAKP